MSDHSPSISATAFACPHCGAYTTQDWYRPFVEQYPEKSRTPQIPNEEFIEKVANAREITNDQRKALIKWAQMMIEETPFTFHRSETRYLNSELCNLSISQCFNCGEMAVWVHDNLVYPRKKTAVPAADEMPGEIKRIFEEARGILEDSPRGAAALLRLCVQLLCVHLVSRNSYNFG